MSGRLRYTCALALAACGAPSTPPATTATTSNTGGVTAGCESITVDLYAGTVNGAPITASMDQLKAALPCATGDSPESDDMNYGGGVFYTQHELYLYTRFDFINVRQGFTGTLKPQLLTGEPLVVTVELGEPDHTDEDGRDYYDHAPGCIVVRHDDTTVHELWAHTMSCADAVKFFEEW